MEVVNKIKYQIRDKWILVKLVLSILIASIAGIYFLFLIHYVQEMFSGLDSANSTDSVTKTVSLVCAILFCISIVILPLLAGAISKVVETNYLWLNLENKNLQKILNYFISITYASLVCFFFLLSINYIGSDIREITNSDIIILSIFIFKTLFLSAFLLLNIFHNIYTKFKALKTSYQISLIIPLITFILGLLF